MTAAEGAVRDPYVQLSKWLAEVPPDILDNRRREAELLFRRIGITFAVYGAAEAQERLIPFDVLPRILSAGEWDLLRRGLEQRVKALNLYIKDIYGAREVLRAGVIPAELVYQNPGFPAGDERTEGAAQYLCPRRRHRYRARRCREFLRARGQCAHASGVSYMLENREIMMRLFPELFSRHRIAPVDNYPDEVAGDAQIGRTGARALGADGRAADAGHLQLGLFRAFVPCRQAGH